MRVSGLGFKVSDESLGIRFFCFFEPSCLLTKGIQTTVTVEGWEHLPGIRVSGLGNSKRKHGLG